MYILEFFLLYRRLLSCKVKTLRKHAGNEEEIMFSRDLPIAVTGSVKEFTDTMKERK